MSNPENLYNNESPPEIIRQGRSSETEEASDISRREAADRARASEFKKDSELGYWKKELEKIWKAPKNTWEGVKKTQKKVVESVKETPKKVLGGVKATPRYMWEGVKVTPKIGGKLGGASVGFSLLEVPKTLWKEIKMISSILWKATKGEKPPKFSEIWKSFFDKKKDKGKKE